MRDGVDRVAPLGEVDLGRRLDEPLHDHAELLERVRRHALLHLGQVLLDQLHHVRRHREARLHHHDRALSTTTLSSVFVGSSIFR